MYPRCLSYVCTHVKDIGLKKSNKKYYFIKNKILVLPHNNRKVMSVVVSLRTLAELAFSPSQTHTRTPRPSPQIFAADIRHICTVKIRISKVGLVKVCTR